MKIIIAIKSAAFRSLRSWESILIIWFSSLLLAGILAVPMKGALKSGLGNSMITEKLANGINLEVFTDLGATYKSMTSSFSAAIFIAILTGFLLNTFLMGGLFNRLKGFSGKFSGEEFFQACAKYFWSFLVISLIISLIVFTVLILTVILPYSLARQAEPPGDGIVFNTLRIGISIFFLLLTILLLVVDYARAWQVSKERNACFKAIGFGFSQTFRTFLSSYPLMIIILIIEFLYGWLILKILPPIKPVTGSGIFLLFLLSQFLFFIRILLKTWRYGSVTSLMEQRKEVSS